MKEKFRYINHKIKEKGVFHYIRLIARIIVKNFAIKNSKLFVFEYLLNEPVSTESEQFIIIQRFDSYNESFNDFATARGHWYEDHARNLFLKGNMCFTIIIDGRIVSCLWTSFNEVYLPDVEYTLKVPDDVAPLIDGYTIDRFRGLGFYKILWFDCINFLISSNKYTRIYGFISNKNKKSLKVHDNLDLKRIILKIRLIKIFGIRVHIKQK